MSWVNQWLSYFPTSDTRENYCYGCSSGRCARQIWYFAFQVLVSQVEGHYANGFILFYYTSLWGTKEIVYIKQTQIYD